MTVTIGLFAITALPKGAAVQFPVADPELLPRFKDAFPRARFQHASRSWHVPGVRAANRVTRFADTITREQREAQVRIDQVLRDAEFDGSPVPLDTPGLEGRAYLAALTHNGERLTTRHVLVMVKDDHIRVGFPYDAEAVALVRVVPGAHFLRHLRVWSVPIAKVRDLHGVLGQMEEALARASAAAAATGAQGADVRALEAAAQARRAGRVLMLLDLRPIAGSVIRVGAEARLIEGYGRAFLLDARTASVSAPHFLGEIGQRCCYAYTRAATPGEAAALEAEEAFRRIRRQRFMRVAQAKFGWRLSDAA